MKLQNWSHGNQPIFFPADAPDELRDPTCFQSGPIAGGVAAVIAVVVIVVGVVIVISLLLRYKQRRKEYVSNT